MVLVVTGISYSQSANDGFNPDADGAIFSIAVQADGKILVGGEFTTIGGVTRNYIARLNPDGSLNTAFNPNANNWVYSIVAQADGKVLIGGGFYTISGVTRNCIARLNPDGSLDIGFNPNASGEVDSIAVQADGKVLVGGGFYTMGGVTRHRIARLNPDGSLDTGFNPNASSEVYSIAMQADEKILVGGEFTTIGGVTRSYIARLNPDGSLDTGFNPNASGKVYSIAVQADGKVLVGGGFTVIGGAARNCIARLTNTDAALQELSVSPSGFTVAWMRGQASPDVWMVIFERSSDGVTWTSLGNGTRIMGGWQLTGLSLPIEQNLYLRARGYATGGLSNASVYLFESVRIFYLQPTPSIYFDTVQEVFIGYYQRPAAPAGLVYWANRLFNSGGDLNEIIEAFANSTESRALHGDIIDSTNIRSVVTSIFQALFDRDPAPTGLNYYENGFNSGQFTPATIMLNVLDGAQNIDLQSVNNKVTASNLFTNTIDPDLDGANFQAIYSGDTDAQEARNWLSTVTSDPATIPTQDEVTLFIKTYIADPGDPILNP